MAAGTITKPLEAASMKFRIVRRLEDADANAVLVTLYRCPTGHVRGWYVGPLLRLREGGQVPYAPRSQKLLGIIAVLRAHETAKKLDLDCYVIDPDDLWGDLSPK